MILPINRILLTLLVVLLSTTCFYRPTKELSYDPCLSLIKNCLKENIIIKMNTNKGNVTFELNAQSAPLSASHFLSLVESGLYKGTIFNRVIRQPFPFVLQGGFKDSKYDLESKLKSENESYIHKNNVALSKIPLEIKLQGEDKPRYNKIIYKYDEFNRIKLKHNRGALAMARSEPLDSASIQFYIPLKDLPELDGRYAVFGRVVNGMNVIDSLNEGDLILNMKVIKD